MKQRCLYLVSSSASKEYVSDCLESLALPRGAIHHFRYRDIYLDDALRAALASKPGHLARPLRDLPVVVVYLYQERTTVGSWKPAVTRHGGPYVPLRCARLEDAYLEGDVAHFYFEVTDYVRPRIGRLTARQLLNGKIKFRVSRDKDAKPSYAHVASNLRLGAKRTEDATAFQEFVSTAYRPSEWRTRSLGSMPLDITYAVVFVRVVGLFREKGNELIQIKPELRRLVGNPTAEYRIQAGEIYHLQIVTRLGTRLVAELPGQGDAMLRLSLDPGLFKALGTTECRISSNYDLVYWPFLALPGGVPRSVLNIFCEHGQPADRDEFVRRELICPALSLPVAIASS